LIDCHPLFFLNLLPIDILYVLGWLCKKLIWVVEVEVQKILVVTRNYDPPKMATKYDLPLPPLEHSTLAKTYSKFHNQFGWCSSSHVLVGFFLGGTATKVIFFSFLPCSQCVPMRFSRFPSCYPQHVPNSTSD